MSKNDQGDSNSDTTPDAIPTAFIDNSRVIVTEWRFAPGAHTGWHKHELDYVVVPLTTGQLKIQTSKTEFVIADLVAGVPYYRDLGVEHDVINHNDYEFAFIEVEIKPE